MPTTFTEIISFCESCGAYASPLLTGCPQCGWQRPVHAILPPPGMPLWKTDLGAPVRANALPVDELVIFAWGDRESPGGVTALEQASGRVRWQVKLPYLPESGLVLCADKVLCTTIGFLNNGAELIALNAADGSLAWRKPLSAGGYTQPVALNNRLVYAAAFDGSIRAFDFNTGAPINGFHVQMPPGNTWLTLFGDELVVLCECGEIDLLAAATGKTRLSQRIPTGGRISSPPAIYDKNKLLFGLADGRLAEFDVYRRKLDILVTFERRVICAPRPSAGMLYVGSNDRHLRALDSAQKAILWEHRFGKSPTTSPMIQDGMIYCGVRDGCLHALDAASGEAIWQFAFPKIEDEQDPPVLCDPACVNGMVFAGSDDGCAYALPWHLGRFEWGARHLQKSGAFSQAAELMALAASSQLENPAHQNELHQQAVELWRRSGQPDRAAFYLVGQPGAQRAAADQFCAAGQSLAGLYPARAASLLWRAAEAYEGLNDKAAASKCSRLAADVDQVPYLSLRIVNCPAQWPTEKPQEVGLEVKNLGNAAALNVSIRLGGSLTRPVVLRKNELPVKDVWPIFQVLTAAGQGIGHLDVEACCQDGHKRNWTASQSFEINILPPPPEIIIEDNSDVRDINIDGPQPPNIRVKNRSMVGVIRYGIRRPHVSVEDSWMVGAIRHRTQPSSALHSPLTDPPPAPDAEEETGGRKCPVCGKFRGKNDFCDECGITLTDADEPGQP